MTATVSPLPMPRAWRALASRFTRSWSWAKVRLSPSQVRATRSGTTEAAIIRNSLVFMRYLRRSPSERAALEYARERSCPDGYHYPTRDAQQHRQALVGHDL